jgi:hypothetical protein
MRYVSKQSLGVKQNYFSNKFNSASGLLVALINIHDIEDNLGLFGAGILVNMGDGVEELRFKNCDTNSNSQIEGNKAQEHWKDSRINLIPKYMSIRGNRQLAC